MNDNILITVPNVDVALRGYDPLDGKALLGQSDPGLKNQIFNPSSFTSGKGLEMFNSLHCSLTSKLTVVNNYVDYREQQSGDFKMEANDYGYHGTKIPVIIASVNHAKSSSSEYSQSSSFNYEKDLFTKSHGVSYVSRAKCETHQINVGPYTLPDFTDNFKDGLMRLKEYSKKGYTVEVGTYL